MRGVLPRDSRIRNERVFRRGHVTDEQRYYFACFASEVVREVIVEYAVRPACMVDLMRATSLDGEWPRYDVGDRCACACKRRVSTWCGGSCAKGSPCAIEGVAQETPAAARFSPFRAIVPVLKSLWARRVVQWFSAAAVRSLLLFVLFLGIPGGGHVDWLGRRSACPSWVLSGKRYRRTQIRASLSLCGVYCAFSVSFHAVLFDLAPWSDLSDGIGRGICAVLLSY